MVDEIGPARYLPPDGPAHAGAQVAALSVFGAASLLDPLIDPVGADVAVIWGVVVIAVGSTGALVGTLVGLAAGRLRRTARWTTVAVGLLAGLGAATAVLLLGGDGTPCSLGVERCAPAPREWIAGLAGLETALLLHAVTSWNAVQLRRGWRAARSVERL